MIDYILAFAFFDHRPPLAMYADIRLKDFPPPAQYDHPYAGPGSVLIEPLAQVRKGCPPIIHGECYGWSWRNAKPGWPCTIMLPKVEGAITQADQDMVRRSEVANCNGWPKGKRE